MRDACHKIEIARGEVGEFVIRKPDEVPVWLHRVSIMCAGTRRRAIAQRGKQLFDYLAALVAIIVLTPLFVVITAALFLSSVGSPFYIQRRRGIGFKPFRIIKFQTMRPSAHKKRARMYSANEVDGILFKLKHDPRVTRIGLLLRKWDLDELPQLWNVFEGSMSLIGPRPFSVEVFKRPVRERTAMYQAWIEIRHRVRAGVTGLWQVCGRNCSSFEAMMNLDMYYVTYWSPLLDLWILWRTVFVVLLQYGSLHQAPMLRRLSEVLLGAPARRAPDLSKDPLGNTIVPFGGKVSVVRDNHGLG